MPTETVNDEPVQVPAQPTDEQPVVTVEPGVDYDPYRGVGGDYTVDEQGYRVPLK